MGHHRQELTQFSTARSKPISALLSATQLLDREISTISPLEQLHMLTAHSSCVRLLACSKGYLDQIRVEEHSSYKMTLSWLEIFPARICVSSSLWLKQLDNLWSGPLTFVVTLQCSTITGWFALQQANFNKRVLIRKLRNSQQMKSTSKYLKVAVTLHYWKVQIMMIRCSWSCWFILNSLLHIEPWFQTVRVFKWYDHMREILLQNALLQEITLPH